MLHSPFSPAEVTQQSSALAANRSESSNSLSQRSKDKQLWCDHCNKPYHTKETCWEIHGKPANWKTRSQRKSNQSAYATESVAASTKSDQPPFTAEQMELLRNLLSQSKFTKGSDLVPQSSTASIAQRGNIKSSFLSQKLTGEGWIVDSGASDHMTGSAIVFCTYGKCVDDIRVTVADGTHSTVAGQGHIDLSSLKLQNVLHVPFLQCNLLSVSKITKDLNCAVTFFPSHCVFQDLSLGRMIGNAEERNGLYYLSGVCSPSRLNNVSLSVTSNSDVMLWHKRLGHPNFTYLKRLYPGLFNNKELSSFQCEHCIYAKQPQQPHPIQPYKSSQPFHLIHSDIWGPAHFLNVTGSRWFITFIDDHTRTCWVYLMKDKSEAGSIFRQFHKLVTNIFQSSIHILRTDNGREYFAHELNNYLVEHGIFHQSSCAYTPQQNGIAERKNRHLLEVARSIMFTTHVPNFFWGEGVLTTAYLINHTPSKTLKFQTPLNCLLKFFPHVRMLNSRPPRVFGCVAFVHHTNPNRGKLEPRAIKCIFLGYSPTQKGYKCYCPTSKQFYVSCDVTFLENEPFYSNASLQGEKSNEDNHWDSSISLPISQNFFESTQMSSKKELNPTLNQNQKQILVISRRPQVPLQQTDAMFSSLHCDPSQHCCF